MFPKINELKEQIQGLGIDKGIIKNLLKSVKLVEKQIVRLDFRLKRTENDKYIAVNLLEKTIEDLEKQQVLLADANRKLSLQNDEIEHKNQVLVAQTLQLEEQSKELQDHIQKLENSYHELEQFSYIASHDLKSPLRNIAGFSQLLQRRYKGKLDKTADEFIDFIVKSTVHMGEVIRDLLEYAQTGREKIGFEPTDLNDLLETVQFNLQTEIKENNVTIEIENLPNVIGHRSSLSQVFQNLISNSIKFRSEKEPIIKIKSELEGKYWKFKVIDNGIGLDERYQEKMFLPFQRIQKERINGTGIGLAICKKIIRLHKGDIYYRSKLGEGTTFVFTIYQHEVN